MVPAYDSYDYFPARIMKIEFDTIRTGLFTGD